MEEKQGWIPDEDLHTMEGLADAESGRRMRRRPACSETGGEDRVELTGKERRFRKTCAEDLERASADWERQGWAGREKGSRRRLGERRKES